jgi:MFS family permease
MCLDLRLGMSLLILSSAMQELLPKSQTNIYSPILWGPLSEIKGRRLPLVIAAFGTAIFHFAVAVSKDLQSILINRFFAGFFGTSSLAVSGAVMVDMFDNKSRGIAVRVLTNAAKPNY